MPSGGGGGWPGGVWARETGTICPFGVFSPLLWHVFAQFGGNPCSEASCGVVTFSLVLKAFQVVLGSCTPEVTICPFRARIWPFRAPKPLRFKGKMANFEAKNAMKNRGPGKKRQKDKGYRFHACKGGGGPGGGGFIIPLRTL